MNEQKKEDLKKRISQVKLPSGITLMGKKKATFDCPGDAGCPGDSSCVSD